MIAQRLVELTVARSHERILMASGAREVDKAGYKYLVLMHLLFFVSFLSEELLLNRPLNPAWRILLPIFIVAQFLRYWAIFSLGAYWNTKILVATRHPPIRKGPYRFFRHPNYAAVATEFVVAPLLFSCCITAAVFTIMNAILLRRRIGIEVRALDAEWK